MDLLDFATSMSQPPPQHSGYRRGCQCERCEAFRERSREYSRANRHVKGCDCDRCRHRRKYKTAKQRAYDNLNRDKLRAQQKVRYEAKLAAMLAARAKPCSNRNPTAHEPGAVKPFDQFYADSSRRLGVMPQCIACVNDPANYARLKADPARLAALRERQREYRHGLYESDRTKSVEVYGGQCEHCGQPDSPECRLEFDHVNDDGAEHRKVENSTVMLARIAKTGRRIEDWKIRLLCPKCHRKVTAANRLIMERARRVLAAMYSEDFALILATERAKQSAQDSPTR